MGGSGGGGGAGDVSYPGYMEDVHFNWLNDTGDDQIEISVTMAMNNAQGSSPWSGVTAYPATTDLAANTAAVAAFAAILAGLDDLGDWDDIYSQAILSIGTFTTLAVTDIGVSDTAVTGAAVDDLVAVLDAAAVDAIAVDDAAVLDADGVTDAAIILDVDAFADQLDDEISNKILPRFRRGMQDIGAVVSSSFALGEACIEGFRDRDVSRHNSTLRVSAALKNADVNVANMDKEVRIELGNQAKDLDLSKTNQRKNIEIALANMSKQLDFAKSDQMKDVEVAKININKSVQVALANLSKAIDIVKTNQSKDIEVGEFNIKTDSQYTIMFLEAAKQMSQNMLQRISWQNDLMRTTIETNRIKIVAMKEMTEANNSYGENDALWDLEVFQYGANVMASIGGGTAVQGKKKSNPVASAIGGGLTGAASGAMIGGQASSWSGPYAAIGAAVGAIVGGAAGYLSS